MFSAKNLQIYRGNSSSSTQGKDTTAIHTFKDITSTVGVIKGYFPPYLGQGANQDGIAIGDHFVIEGSDTTIFTRILSLNPFTVSTDYFSGASGLSVGTPIVAIDGNAAIITGETLQMEIADADHSGILTNVSQTIGGIKTFTSPPIFPVIPNNVVYHNFATGVDAVGNGSVIFPYKTAAYALAQITTATVTNPFTLITLGGQSNEAGTIALKPYVNWKGETEQTIINNANPIILDVASWTANPSGYFYLEDLTINAAVTLDFTTIPATGYPYFQFNTVYINVAPLVINGNAAIFPFFYSYTGYYYTVIINNADVETNGNYYFSLTLGSTSSQVNNIYITSQADTFNDLIINSMPTGSITTSMAMTSGITYTSVHLNNSNTTLSTDSSSLNLIAPTITGGANLIYLDDLKTINTSIIGSGYRAITLNDIDQTLTNPCPNYLVVSGDGNANLILPPMNTPNSLESNINHLMVVVSNTTIDWSLKTNGSAQQLIINPGDVYLIVITDNSSIDGTFTSAKIGTAASSDLSGINHGDLTTSNVSTSTPNATGMFMTLGNSSTPQNLQLCAANGSNPGVLTATAQTIGGAKTFTSAPNLSSLNATSVTYLDGSNNISASTNFIYNSSGQLILTDQGDGNLLLLNNQNAAATANQLGFQNNGTLRFSIGHNNSADQSYVFSSASVLKFATNNTEVARFVGTTLGIGTTTPNAAAIIDLVSTTQAFGLPAMTTTQKNALSGVVRAGMMVFDTTLAKACVYSGSAWQTITSI